jgi:hypothetical protein
MAVPPGYVLKVLKAIYGLPQGGRNFWKLLRKVILSLGFIHSEHAPCFFYRRTDAGFIIVMTYVDDVTITTVMKINDCGVIESFLGMHFQYNEQKRYWHITQGTYIKDLCTTMGLRQESSKACYTPEVKQVWSTEASTAKTDEERVRVSVFSPRSKVGSILWATLCCRPDIMHCVKSPSQCMTDPGNMVVKAIERIARYMLGTADEGLRLQGDANSVQLHVASDADDTGGMSRRSMLCHVQWLGAPLGNETTLIPRAFFQWNNLWDIPCTSGSMESGLYAIHTATKGAAPKRGLLSEIGLFDGSATSTAVGSMSSKVTQGGYTVHTRPGMEGPVWGDRGG